MAINSASSHAVIPAATRPLAAREAHTSRLTDIQPRIGSAWLAAALSIAFIGAMIVAVEALVGVILGQMMHSNVVGGIAVAAFVLPTLAWLLFSRLPIAIRAERDAF
ncbi:hypothetical protein RDV64_02840 [Acuticoccus sp. MNP-M23]|uniref:hypothetical protein n=1 Tax=Acuticoccus sp. MNP-M23 TaxID=3072793 RepID=UPI0028166741|nr:hypothetical protein [Acuticoccus sp. MNP-M23]WMS43357.1 hypothetical protein RDV64_02840 [Acuticoccus sp. MNP-M23]